MPDVAEQFDTWAVVELFGHQQIAGRVAEQTIGGSTFVRVDVPETPESVGYTKLYGPGAIYAITPTTEAIARANAHRLERYRTPVPYTPAVPEQRQLVASTADVEVVGDDNDDDWHEDEFRPFPRDNGDPL